MRKLSILNTPLIDNSKKTHLTSAVAATDTTLTVDNIVGLTINQILLIGEFGNEQSEIKKTHASTAPSGSTVTLASALSFAHSAGTSIYILDYDQIQIYWAETKTGTKELLATVDIQADQVETLYTNTSKGGGYYFIRFHNSLTATASSYSDAIPYDDFTSNTVAKVIEYALNRNKLDGFTKLVNHDFCLEEINSCLRYIRGKKKKWTHLQDFDYELGNATRGEYSLALPTDVWNKSHKSILAARLSDRTELTYLDKKDFDDKLIGVVQTTVKTQASAGDTELVLDRTTDLSADGTIMVNGNLITYEEKDDDTGELSGIPASGDGAITETLAVGTNVWQNYAEGKPEYFTVYDGYLYWWPMTGSSKPIWGIRIDFWTEAPEVDSDGDTLDIYRFDMVKHWLTWAIRMQLKNDGIRDLRDGDYTQFELILADAIKQDIHGQRYRTIPAINKISY